MGVGCSKCVEPSNNADKEQLVETTSTPRPGQGNPKDAVFWTSKGTFDYNQPTEDQYAVKHFTGPNRDIRPLLDYTYHKKYNEDRMILQDHMIEKHCVTGAGQKDLLLPWVIFTAGAMGAGKGYVVKWMEQQGCLPLSQFVTVDPDAIRQALPEWDGYVKQDPITAAVKTQKEAGCMAEILGYKALNERWNIIFDGSLRDVAWYKVYFAKLRQSFPGVRLMILHIQANRQEVLDRAEKRGKETGRMVPRALLESSMDAVPKSVQELAPFVDVAIRVINSGGKDPQLLREGGAPHPAAGVAVTPSYINRLWKPIDADGDGQLSAEEVQAGLASGILTQAILETIDTDGDGSISKEELMAARKTAHDAASKLYA